jgi:hypothetical protein
VHADAAAKEHGMWLLYESITQTRHSIFYEATTSPSNYLFHPGMSILHCINVQPSHIITYFLCFIKLRFCYEPDNTMRAAPCLDSILFIRSKLLLIDQQKKKRVNREDLFDLSELGTY